MQPDHAEMIDWARRVLRQPEATAEAIVDTPWSSVVALHTPISTHYLKRTAPDLFIESSVINTCRNLCGVTAIPEIIAQNEALHCFLMASCGDMSLRALFQGGMNIPPFIEAMGMYRAFQRATVQHVSAFLALGVPDWRLAQFPALYDGLVRDDLFLKAQGLDADQARDLRQAAPALSALCLELAGYAIPESLNHSDLNDNNILITTATQKISIIDLGETAVDHPFLSLAATLARTTGRYVIRPHTPEYQQLQTACFAGFLDSEAATQRAIALTKKLLPVYALLAHVRLAAASGPALGTVPRMEGRLRGFFTEFLLFLND